MRAEKADMADAAAAADVTVIVCVCVCVCHAGPSGCGTRARACASQGPHSESPALTGEPATMPVMLMSEPNTTQVTQPSRT